MAVHHINKVVLDFSFPAKEKDTALQQTRNFFYEKILPPLTAACDAVKGHVYIDKLEIDLGAVLPGNLQQEFIKSFVIKDSGYPAPAAASTVPPQPPVAKPAAAALLFYLKNGYWEWNFQQLPGMEQARFIRALFNNTAQAAAFFQQLQLLPSYSGKRLLLLLAPFPQLQQVLVNVIKMYHPVMPALLPFLPAGWEQQAFRESSFFFELVSRFLQVASIATPQALVPVLQDIAVRYDMPVPENNTALPEGKPLSAAKALRWIKAFFGQSRLTGKAAKARPPAADNGMKPGGKNKKADRLSPLSEKTDYNNSVPYPPAENRLPETKQEYPLLPDEEKILISNAGLILFHPFLPAAFTDLGWLDEKRRFKDERVQQKAILLLQYLCNGKSRQAEHELVLNKLLCNWPVVRPLSLAANFSKKEKQVCLDLVEALREYWTVLQNTSAAGLVQSFILRNGLIRCKEDGFLLQVEKKSIDILIESLPFSLFTIKLPWNEQIVYTEW